MLSQKEIKRAVRAIMVYSLLYILAGAMSANADEANTTALLKKGMSYADVSKLLGGPIDKEEFETKREEIWIYPESQVVFLNGKVTSWASAAQPRVDEAPEIKVPVKEVPAKKGKDEQGFEVDEILTEIMKEVPSADEAPPTSPATSPQAVPPISPNSPRLSDPGRVE